jgi:uncharacterized protein with FMN-binding domain
MRRVILAVFGTIAGLVGLLSFKSHSASVATTPTAISAGPAAGTTSSSPTSVPATTSSAAKAKAATTTRTVTGNSVNTRWGPVQVKITVTNGKITNATAVDYPNNNGRDQEINARAIPTLVQESIGKSKSSANIDTVSGATYTSDGYIQSLQSALDKL